TARLVWQIVNNQGAGRAFTNLDLSFTDLSHGNLTNAQLQRADFSGVDFNFTDLSGANLTGAILRQLDLRGTILNAQTVIAAKWRTIWDIINDPKANRVHTNTDLSQGFWVDLMLETADLRSSNFTGGLMIDANFRGV